MRHHVKHMPLIGEKGGAKLFRVIDEMEYNYEKFLVIEKSIVFNRNPILQKIIIQK